MSLDLQDIWDAFWMLHPSRINSMGYSGIPLTEIVSYFKDLHGIDHPDILMTKVILVRRLDMAWLDLEATRRAV